MEKKNTILLTVIAVATLLVAVVGATFAYFTATSGNDGDGSSTGAIQAAQLSSVTLRAANLGVSDDVIYPGTINYASMSVQAVKTGDNAATDTNNYTVQYTLNGTVTLSEAFTAGEVTYTVYRTTSAVGTPVTCDPVTATPNASGTQYTQSCTVDSTLTGLSGDDVVATGTVSGTSATISETLEEVTTGGDTYYYYLVVSYESTGKDQNADQGKTITASLTQPTITSTDEA